MSVANAAEDRQNYCAHSSSAVGAFTPVVRPSDSKMAGWSQQEALMNFGSSDELIRGNGQVTNALFNAARNFNGVQMVHYFRNSTDIPKRFIDLSQEDQDELADIYEIIRKRVVSIQVGGRHMGNGFVYGNRCNNILTAAHVLFEPGEDQKYDDDRMIVGSSNPDGSLNWRVMPKTSSVVDPTVGDNDVAGNKGAFNIEGFKDRLDFAYAELKKPILSEEECRPEDVPIYENLGRDTMDESLQSIWGGDYIRLCFDHPSQDVEGSISVKKPSFQIAKCSVLGKGDALAGYGSEPMVFTDCPIIFGTSGCPIFKVGENSQGKKVPVLVGLVVAASKWSQVTIDTKFKGKPSMDTSQGKKVAANVILSLWGDDDSLPEPERDSQPFKRLKGPESGHPVYDKTEALKGSSRAEASIPSRSDGFESQKSGYEL